MSSGRPSTLGWFLALGTAGAAYYFVDSFDGVKALAAFALFTGFAIAAETRPRLDAIEEAKDNEECDVADVADDILRLKERALDLETELEESQQALGTAQEALNAARAVLEEAQEDMRRATEELQRAERLSGSSQALY